VATKMAATEQDALLAALTTDYTQARLSDTDRALLNYAVKLTTASQTIDQQDIQKLRDHGLEDRAIHDVCAITAYFNFVNRMANGLGVELEPDTDGNLNP